MTDRDSASNSTNPLATSEWQSTGNPMLEYYDSDFPSALLSRYPENFDSKTTFQGLALDVPRYVELAKQEKGPILELGCGTGRVAVPLAREDFDVTGVDFSEILLETFEENLTRVAPGSRERIRVVLQDMTNLDLSDQRFRMAIMAFNSLLCIPDFQAQRRVLLGVSRYLVDGGLLVLDLINPLLLPLEGDPNPIPFFTRRHPKTGYPYTRFAMLSAFDARCVQRLYGWYDQLDNRGVVHRRTYETKWRPVHRFEIELMLEQAGFAIEALEGGHQREPYIPTSPRMFVLARKKTSPQIGQAKCNRSVGWPNT